MDKLEISIGKQVVCISDNWKITVENPGRIPKVHDVFTITEIMDDNFFHNQLFLVFEENYTIDKRTNLPVQWQATCFRPCKKTDISIFTSILNKTPKEIVENVS